jgi:formate dehydrogenase (coenzyme F420) alpha subunit
MAIDQIQTICPYCGTGCSVNLIVQNNKITGTLPNNRSPVNEGKLCPKGTYCHQFITNPERLKKPLIRRGDVFVESEWDAAYYIIDKHLKHYSSDEIGVLGSAHCSNEDNYVLMKFAHGVLRTCHLDHCARQCHDSTINGLSLSFGMGVMTNTIADISESDCILCLGSNTFEQHPIIGRQIIKAKSRGAVLIYADPRYTPTAMQADLFLQFYSGSDVGILNCIMGEIIRKGLEDKNFISTRTRDYEAFRRVVLQKIYEPSQISRFTGIKEEDLILAAEWIGKAKTCTVLYAMGLSHNTGGVNNVRAVANLMMLTGNIGHPGTGVNALCGQSNVQGTCDAGCLPGFFPGYQAVTDGQKYQKIAKAWNFKDGISPPREGYDINRMFRSISEKPQKIKAMFLVGENPLVSDPDPEFIRETLKKLKFLVISDIFFTETCQYADVVLPAACFAEKDGTVTNTERRVQRIRKAVEPPGIAKPDWQIIKELASVMGYEEQFSYQTVSDIFREITEINPHYHGMTFEKVSRPDGMFWPEGSTDSSGRSILYRDKFLNSDGKGVFCPVEWKFHAEKPDKKFPFLLTTGRIIWHSQSGTMTWRSKNLLDEVNDPYIEMHGSDARYLKISDGDMVKVSSKDASMICKARIVPDIKNGVVFMPFNFVSTAMSPLLEAFITNNPELSGNRHISVSVERIISGDRK